MRQFTDYSWRDVFTRVAETTGATANMVPQIAANNCDQPVLANYTISNNHGPPWFSARVRWRALNHRYARLTNRTGPLQSLNCVFYESIPPVPLSFFSGNREAKFAKIFRFLIDAAW
jgi:hypothetical protein